MKNFTFSKYIGVMLLLVTSTWFSWFISGCKEDRPCLGFQTEPAITFHSDSIPFRIEVTSPNGFFVKFETDSLHHSVKIPLDMNADQLEMDVFIPDFKGKMVFNYQISLKECEDDHNQLMYVEKFSLDKGSTFDEVYYIRNWDTIKFSEVSVSGLDLVPGFKDEEGFTYGFTGHLYLK